MEIIIMVMLELNIINYMILNFAKACMYDIYLTSSRLRGMSAFETTKRLNC